MVQSKGKGMNGAGKGTITCGHIWEVSFLIYNKIPFIKTELQNGKVVFVFPDNPEVQRILQEFILNPEVRVQEYIGIFQRVKNLIYQQKGQENGQEKAKDKRQVCPGAVCNAGK